MLRRTPAGAKALVPDDERLLAWGTVGVAQESYAVATDRALYIPVPDVAHSVGTSAPVGLVRIPWEGVTKATWDDDFVLVVEGRTEGSARDSAWRVRLHDPRSLPTVVYERVTSMIVVSERVNLVGEAGARIVGRRAGDGIRWTVTFDPGLNPADPELRRRADGALADLRATWGL